MNAKMSTALPFLIQAKHGRNLALLEVAEFHPGSDYFLSAFLRKDEVSPRSEWTESELSILFSTLKGTNLLCIVSHAD